MRIIAGSLGGRIFISPTNQRTHPMSDKMRGALFNALGSLEGLTVLDAFAGSGALSFEAISRGAQQATAIDIDKNAQKAIAASIAMLELKNKVKLIKASVNAWLQTTDESFNVVLCDPPYDDLQEPVLMSLTERIKANGLFVLSWPPKATPPEFESLEQLQHREYGDSTLVFYRRIG